MASGSLDLSRSFTMVGTASNTTRKFVQNASGGILDRLPIITMGTADPEIFVRASSIKASERYKVICMPSPVNFVFTVKA